MLPCPHCKAIAVIAPHPKFRWVCGACGGPRVPNDAPGRRSPESSEELRVMLAARRAQAAAFGLRAGSILFAAVTMLGGGLAALLWIPAHAAAMVVSAFAALALVLSFVLSRRAKASDARALVEADRAWVMAAEGIMKNVGRDVSARELAAWMRTDEAHAEKMLTELSVDDRVRIDVGNDAELRFVPREAEGAVQAGAQAQAPAQAQAEVDAQEDEAMRGTTNRAKR